MSDIDGDDSFENDLYDVVATLQHKTRLGRLAGIIDLCVEYERITIGSSEDANIIISRPGTEAISCVIELSSATEIFVINTAKINCTLINGKIFHFRTKLKHNDILSINEKSMVFCYCTVEEETMNCKDFLAGDSAKAEFEASLKRLRIAERAAIGAVETGGDNRDKDMREKKGKKSAQTKRKLEKRRKELKKRIEKYVGVGKIKEVYDKNNVKRSFLMVCPDCGFRSTRLHQHLATKHDVDLKEAKMRESKIRVMYLWAKKDHHGIAKPLPCEKCCKWFCRLDNHLKVKHKYNKIEIKKVMDKARASNLY